MGLYVWGTGCSAGELVRHGLDPQRIAAFIDNDPMKDTFLGRMVIMPSQLRVEDVELVLITSRFAEEIHSQCAQLGLKDEQLFFLKNAYRMNNLNGPSSKKAEDLLGKDVFAAMNSKCRIITEPAAIPDLLPPCRETESDYIRTKTLEMLSTAVADIPGAIAELGVFRGYFARLMNQLLPERTLHLFDSFEGFQTSELEQEQQAGTCTEGLAASHKNTAVEQVLRIMNHPEQVMIHQGYFPQSLSGMVNYGQDECFALVSLDADFEETTYEGLCYFWPRMSAGGYIMLHDYNSTNLAGVKRAVERYEKDQQIRLPKVPVCDIGGTLVLCKV